MTDVDLGTRKNALVVIEDSSSSEGPREIIERITLDPRYKISGLRRMLKEYGEPFAYALVHALPDYFVIENKHFYKITHGILDYCDWRSYSGDSDGLFSKVKGWFLEGEKRMNELRPTPSEKVIEIISNLRLLENIAERTVDEETKYQDYLVQEGNIQTRLDGEIVITHRRGMKRLQEDSDDFQQKLDRLKRHYTEEVGHLPNGVKEPEN